MSFLSDGRVFNWFENGPKGPNFLAFLNLAWKPAGVDQHMLVLTRVAKQLSEEPVYWASVIRDANWRFPLIGCACLLVSRNTGYLPDLCFRFANGSMVIPQIAVALGLLHPDEACVFLTNAVKASDARKQVIRLVSAQSVLAKLGVLSPSEISRSGWSAVEQDDATLAYNIVEQHWKFWSERQ